MDNQNANNNNNNIRPFPAQPLSHAALAVQQNFLLEVGDIDRSSRTYTEELFAVEHTFHQLAELVISNTRPDYVDMRLDFGPNDPNAPPPMPRRQFNTEQLDVLRELLPPLMPSFGLETPLPAAQVRAFRHRMGEIKRKIQRVVENFRQLLDRLERLTAQVNSATEEGLVTMLRKLLTRENYFSDIGIKHAFAVRLNNTVDSIMPVLPFRA